MLTLYLISASISVMTTQTNIQLKYVNIDGQPSQSFQLALQRQRATRTIKRLVRASLTSTGQRIDEWVKVAELESFDRKHGTHLKAEYEQHKVDKAAAELRAKLFESAERLRNVHGQFVA